MDLITVISVVSGIMGIVGVIIQVLIDKDKIAGLRKDPFVKKTIKLIVLLCFTFAVYGYFIYPSAKVYSWFPSNTVSDSPDPIKSIRLKQLPSSQDFRVINFSEKTLLLDDVFPTALAVITESNKKTYLAGSYGAGIVASTRLPSWEFRGLENMVITDIVVSPSNTNLIWASTNLGVAFSDDSGENWKMTGPIQDVVTDLAPDPDNSMKLLVGTLNGIYTTTDGGLTWMGPELEGNIITSIDVPQLNPNRIYVSCLFGKIYRSDDAGKNWIVIRESDGTGSAPIEIDPENPDTIYIGPERLGLFRSTNAGNSWEFVGLKGVAISSILVTYFPQKTIYIGTDYNRGLYVSTDVGKTWQNSGALNDAIIAIYEDDTPGNILVSTKKNGVLKTSDFGNTWFSMGLASFSVITDFSPSEILIQEGNPSSLIASSNYSKGLFRSTNFGASWSPLDGNNDLMRIAIKDFLIDPRDQNHIYIGGYGGEIFESKNGGNSWKNITANLPKGGYPAIAMIENGDLLTGPSDQGVWMKSINEDLWIPSGLVGYSIETILADAKGANIFALDNNYVLHISHDSGLSWTEASDTFRKITMRRSDETLLGISNKFEVLISKDDARTWQLVIELKPSAQGSSSSLIVDDKTGFLYIAYEKNLLRSKDAGSTWEEFGLPEYGEIQISKGEQLYFIGQQALHISNDNGETFRPVKYYSVVASSTQQVQLTEDVFLLGTTRDGIFASFDNLETWSQTSVGVGKKVLALTLENEVEKRAVALLADFDEVEIATSKDGKLWSINPTPCGSAGENSSNYFGKISDGKDQIWLLKCSDPNGIFAIRPSEINDPVFFDLKNLNLNIIDALLMPDNTLYVLSLDKNTYRVYLVSSFGEKVQPIGQFNNNYKIELSDDSRSDGVLNIKEGEFFVASWYPRPAVPYVFIIAILFSILLCYVIAFTPKGLKEITISLKWISSWFTQNHSVVDQKVSPYFLVFVVPNIILLSVLTFQILPQAPTLSYTIEYQGIDKFVYFIVSKLIQYKITLLTVDGVIFSGILIAYFSVLVLISFILALSARFKGRGGLFPIWFDLISNGFSLFALGIPVIYSLAAVLNNFPDSLNQRIFGLSLQSIVNFWYIFLWFRILAIVLFRVSFLQKMPLTEISTYLAVSTIILSSLAQILLSIFATSLPPEMQPIIGTIPFIPIGLLTGLLIILHSAISRIGYYPILKEMPQISQTPNLESISLLSKKHSYQQQNDQHPQKLPKASSPRASQKSSKPNKPTEKE